MAHAQIPVGAALMRSSGDVANPVPHAYYYALTLVLCPFKVKTVAVILISYW